MKNHRKLQFHVFRTFVDFLSPSRFFSYLFLYFALFLVSFFTSFLVSFLVPFLASFDGSLLVSAEVPCFFSCLFLFFICFFLFLFFYFSSFASFFSSSSAIARHAKIIVVTNARGLPLPYYRRPMRLPDGTNLYYANSEWYPPGCYPPPGAKPKRHLSLRVDSSALTAK